MNENGDPAVPVVVELVLLVVVAEVVVLVVEEDVSEEVEVLVVDVVPTLCCTVISVGLPIMKWM